MADTTKSPPPADRRIFATGDLHGVMWRVADFYEKHPDTAGSLFILLGDVALNYNMGERDAKRKRILANLPYTFLIIHGNHEARPQTVSGYELTTWEGNAAWIHPDYPNQVFLDDGLVQINDKRCLVAGGAYSVDKSYRLAHGENWFPDEQMSSAKKIEVLSAASGKRFDLVLTHTCPYNNRPIDRFLPFVDQSSVDSGMERYLQNLKESMAWFGEWLVGHWHIDRTVRIKQKADSGDPESVMRFLFDDIIEIAPLKPPPSGVGSVNEIE